VPAAGALDVYIAIDAAPERLSYLAANTANRDADRLADRVVEAVLLESLIQWQRKAGLVRVCLGCSGVCIIAELLLHLLNSVCSTALGSGLTSAWQQCRGNLQVVSVPAVRFRQLL
jgi:hypothetical protein